VDSGRQLHSWTVEAVGVGQWGSGSLMAQWDRPRPRPVAGPGGGQARCSVPCRVRGVLLVGAWVAGSSL
jgi:hypothetical protein